MKYAQFLYDEVKPSQLPCDFTGDDLSALLPILSQLEQFKGCEMKVVERYEAEGLEYVTTPEKGVKRKAPVIRDLHTVALNTNLRGTRLVEIYSLSFSPGFYKHHLSNPQDGGVFILPEFISESKFALIKPILVNVDMSELQKFSEPLLVPDGFVQEASTLVPAEIAKRELLGKLIGEFSKKLYEALTTDKSDLPKQGSVIMRVTPGSYEIRGGSEFIPSTKDDYFKC